ncbi:selenoprotein P [Patagioenas fasciata monilis]|uniref:Selenoprotein P n=1 Tax=Patagioenas fasciata monilis TaxID=372326 RepID=A0A1V4KRW6_PATFA|nr:selenoprotein P [Patagioenas fasciata monilis]
MAFRHLIEFTYTAKLMVQGEEEANDVWKAAEYLQMLEAIKALEIRSFRISSLNFELYLQSKINKSPINTTALFLALFSSATELSRSCQGAGEQRIKPSHASRLEDLRVKLKDEGLVNISYVVVNHQGTHSQRKFHLLKESVSESITVYQQDEQQDDVWTTLNGNKDDFLIYDRCGRLVYHLGLPYSFLSFQYVEEAIKIAYCENKCGNCSYTEPDIDGICENITKTAEEELAEIAPEPAGQHSQHHNLHRHRHHHHHHHHREGGRHSKNESHQASESHRHRPHSGRRHRIFGRNRSINYDLGAPV